VLDHGGELASLGIEPVAVGFSPVDALAPLARHLVWPHRFLSDPGRALYGRLGLGRASMRMVFAPRTLAVYATAVRQRAPVHVPVEDIRQLGGDALAVDGQVRVLWSPASPDDRVDVSTIIEAAHRLLA